MTPGPAQTDTAPRPAKTVPPALPCADAGNGRWSGRPGPVGREIKERDVLMATGFDLAGRADSGGVAEEQHLEHQRRAIRREPPRLGVGGLIRCQVRDVVDQFAEQTTPRIHRAASPAATAASGTFDPGRRPGKSCPPEPRRVTAMTAAVWARVRFRKADPVPSSMPWMQFSRPCPPRGRDTPAFVVTDTHLAR